MLIAWAFLKQLQFYILRSSRRWAQIWLGRRDRHPSSLNLPHARLSISLCIAVAQSDLPTSSLLRRTLDLLPRLDEADSFRVSWMWVLSLFGFVALKMTLLMF